jgi:hypothetical protein
MKWGHYYVNDLTGAYRKADPTWGRNTPQTATLERNYITGGVDADFTPLNDPEIRLQAAREWILNYLDRGAFSGLNAIQRADFLRWRELNITFQFPRRLSRKLRADRLSVTLAGQNLALWTSYKGRDPEINVLGRNSGIDPIQQNFLDGIEAFGLPLERRIMLTLRLGF